METRKRKNSVFRHKPLKDSRSIRLIHVQHSEEFNDPIEISFHSINLDKGSSYQTLSYAWHQASATGSKTIFCKGHPLPIYANLHDFLKRLRSKLSTGGDSVNLPIWIDAISIDQGNPVERSQQVKMMAEIYQRSHRLIIWLGEIDVPAGKKWLFEQPRRKGNNDQKVISLIVQLPWFRRRWIIQEVLHGNGHEMWIGSIEIDFLTFMGAVNGSQLANSSIPTILSNTPISRTASTLKRSLLENLWFWDCTECQDARDRIYALLSISKDREDFKVDYESSTEAVYCGIAARIVDSQSAENISAMLVYAICRSTKALRSLKVPRKRTTAQRRPRLSKDRKTSEDLIVQTKHEPKPFVGQIASIEAKLKALEIKEAVRRTLPSWVPDWRNSRRDITPEEQDCVDRCFIKDFKHGSGGPAKLSARVHEQRVRDRYLRGRYQLLTLHGWLFRGCRCTISSRNPTCRGCDTITPTRSQKHGSTSTGQLPEGGNTECWCIDCRTSSLVEHNVLRKNKPRPTICAEQTVCLLKNSAFAFVLSHSDGEGATGRLVYQLETCFLVHPVIGNRNALSQLGEVQEIVLA